jgi:hypothetical protein
VSKEIIIRARVKRSRIQNEYENPNSLYSFIKNFNSNLIWLVSELKEKMSDLLRKSNSQRRCVENLYIRYLLPIEDKIVFERSIPNNSLLESCGQSPLYFPLTTLLPED